MKCKMILSFESISIYLSALDTIMMLNSNHLKYFFVLSSLSELTEVSHFYQYFI